MILYSIPFLKLSHELYSSTLLDFSCSIRFLKSLTLKLGFWANIGSNGSWFQKNSSVIFKPNFSNSCLISLDCTILCQACSSRPLGDCPCCCACCCIILRVSRYSSLVIFSPFTSPKTFGSFPIIFSTVSGLMKNDTRATAMNTTTSQDFFLICPKSVIVINSLKII